MEKNQDKGFTLVELLIVIVILGILATVTVFAVRGITDKGKTNSCDVEARTILTAGEAFYADTGGAAGGFADLSPVYLSDSVSTLNANWVYNGGNATTAATVTAVSGGKCG